MSHRRRQHRKTAKHTKQVKRIEETKKTKTKRNAGIVIVLTLIFLVAYLLASAPPNTMRCFQNGTRLDYRYDAKLFIWVGPESDNQFIRFPAAEDDPTTLPREDAPIGYRSSCQWPITTGLDENAPGERGQNWTAIHIRSPYNRLYTLGDFFTIWSATSAGSTVYLGPDGVSTVRGPTYVSYNYGPELPADPNMVINPGDFINIRVYPSG